MMTTNRDQFISDATKMLKDRQKVQTVGNYVFKDNYFKPFYITTKYQYDGKF